MNRRGTTVLVLLIISTLLSPELPFFPRTAHAQPSTPPPPFVGRVCVVPGDSTSCPLTLQSLRGTGGPTALSVNILGSTIFNAFDIMVRWDFTRMNSTSVDLTGTILATPSTIIQCINGAGLGCGPLDGPGIAHVKLISGTNTTAPAAGRLFKIPFLFAVNDSLPIGYQTGCSMTSVPNTDACVTVGFTSSTSTITPILESIQSQLIGPQLPTPLASVSPPGNITINLSAGSNTLPNVTFITPFFTNLPGTITAWKVQFDGGFSNATGTFSVVPLAVQLVVFKRNSTNTLIEVSAGPLHNPRAILQSRIASFPFFQTNQSVIEFFTDPGMAVLPGELIGVAYTADPSTGFFEIPGVTTTPDPARFVTSSLPVGGTVDLSSPFTGFVECGFGSFCSPSLCPCWSPAVQVFIQVPPPTTDTAGDGISDFVKLTPEMQALGADPCRKTVAVQMDYMTRPRQEAIDTVVQSFDAAPVPAVLPCPYIGFPQKPSGVKLIMDIRNQIPFQDWLNFTKSNPMTFDYVKAAFFDPNRIRSFHYGIFAHDLLPSSSISGVGEIFGVNFMVTLGEWPNGGNVKQQAGTIMHEIGHNLGLDHGGNVTTNFKPDYLSVMNYAFQVTGIVSFTSTGTNVTRFDFSRQALPSLDESRLVETLPLSGLNNLTKWACPDGRHVNFGLTNSPLDWNCNGIADTSPVSVDINNDTQGEVLTGFNDWAHLRYNFTQGSSFGVGCGARCDIGCGARCDIGCGARCDIGTELTYPQAAIIEKQLADFLASPHRSTSTSLNCSPASVTVTGSTKCAATVTDSGTGTPITPTGTLGFTSSQLGTFTPSSNCSLAGSGVSATCTVTYSPSMGSFGPLTISVAYVGDGNHLGSSGSSSVAGLSPILNVTASATLTADLGVQVVIGSDGVTLNCNGHTIDGTATGGMRLASNIGINLTGRSSVNLQNCRVTNFYIGILLVSSSGNNLLGDTATGNGFDGFLLQGSNNNNLVGDTSNNNLGSGFRLVSSSNNNLKTNTANNNGAYGFALASGSNNNTIASNAACGNALFDALQSGSKQNTFSKNKFCTSKGI